MGLKDFAFRATLVPGSVEGLMGFLQSRDISISWVIEAGCNTGSDTLKMAENEEIDFFYLFEPDPVSYETAKTNLQKLESARYSLYQYAVSDIETEYGLVAEGGLGNEGSLITSTFREASSISVKSCVLDSIVPQGLPRSGLLWLDVEGFATNALKGANASLDSIVVSKIEVEYAYMNRYRRKNFSEVLKLMNLKGFILLSVNLNPCYFGDLLLIHKSALSFKMKAYGKSLTLIAKLLHNLVYPTLRKPGYLEPH